MEICASTASYVIHGWAWVRQPFEKDRVEACGTVTAQAGSLQWLYESRSG